MFGCLEREERESCQEVCANDLITAISFLGWEILVTVSTRCRVVEGGSVSSVVLCVAFGQTKTQEVNEALRVGIEITVKHQSTSYVLVRPYKYTICVEHL